MRPTPDRIRETLFNWLQCSVIGARCLDPFAGSGILGFEALSRGAESVLLIEQNRDACDAIGVAIKKLNAVPIELRCGDCQKMLEQAPTQPFDLVFLDPPFRMGLIPPALDRLHRNDWVRAGSLIYIEIESDAPVPEISADWRILKSGSAGEVAFNLWEKI